MVAGAGGRVAGAAGVGLAGVGAAGSAAEPVCGASCDAEYQLLSPQLLARSSVSWPAVKTEKPSVLVTAPAMCATPPPPLPPTTVTDVSPAGVTSPRSKKPIRERKQLPCKGRASGALTCS